MLLAPQPVLIQTTCQRTIYGVEKTVESDFKYEGENVSRVAYIYVILVNTPCAQSCETINSDQLDTTAQILVTVIRLEGIAWH